VRITHLRREFAPQFAPPTLAILISQIIIPHHINLLYHLLHGGTLSLQLLHSISHTIHVQPQHLILSHRLPPLAATAAEAFRHLSCGGNAGIFSLIAVRADQSSGDGVAELELLEEDHLNHRPHWQTFVLCRVGARF